MKLQEFRQQYPQYNDMDDRSLADAIHKKWYADIPKEQVYGTLGVPLHDIQDPEGEGFLQPSKMPAAAMGGYDLAGSMLSKLPGMAVGGLSMLGNLALGKGLGPSIDEGQKIMQKGLPGARFLKGFEPTSEFGKVGQEALEHGRTATGNLGGDSPALVTANELAFDVITGMFPASRAPGVRPGRNIPAERGAALAGEAMAKQEAAPKPVDTPIGTQAELAFGDTHYPRNDYMPTIDPYEMMDRVDERMNDVVTQQKREAGPQADLFAPEGEFPGVARSTEMQQGAELDRVRQEALNSEPNLSVSEPLAPFREGDFDFPLRQEAIEKDPYLGTLRDEFEKAKSDYERMQRWTRQFKKSPPSVIQKMNDAARRYDEVSELAQSYLQNAYRTSTPDKYTGQLWQDKDGRGNMQMPIEKTERPRIGNSGPQLGRQQQTKGLVKSQTYGLGNPRQKGAIDVNELKKAIDDTLRRIEKMEVTIDKLAPAAREVAEKRLEELKYQKMRFENELARQQDPTLHPQMPRAESMDQLRPTKPQAWKAPSKNEYPSVGDKIVSRTGKRGEVLRVVKEGPVPVYRVKWSDRTEGHAAANTIRKDNPFKGPGKKQAGAINFEGFKKEMLDPKKADRLSLKDELDKVQGEWRATIRRIREMDTGIVLDPAAYRAERAKLVEKQDILWQKAGQIEKLLRGPRLDPFKGPGKRQAGAINLEGFHFGYDNLPDWIKEAVGSIAKNKAFRRAHEEGLMDDFGRPADDMAAQQLNEMILQELNNKDNWKKAIAFSDNPHAKFEDIYRKGTIGRQEGAIKLGDDPEFRRFKANLPLPMKKYAKQAYKQYLASKAHERAKKADIYENEPATQVADRIPGLRTWKEEVAPIPVDIPTIKARIMAEDDIGSGRRAKIGRQLVAGGKLLGFGTQNTLVRFTVQQLDNAFRSAQRKIEDLILDENTGFKPQWEKLNDNDMGQTWVTLLAEEGKRDLSKDDMYNLGFKESQVEAASSLRRALDAVYDRLNAVRQELGKKPLEKRLGYIPSRFRGDWTVDVRDAEGTLVHRIGTMTKDGAKRVVEHMQEKHPELTFGDVKHEPLHRFKDASDANAGYQALLEVLTNDDPRVAALESTYGDFMKQQAYEAMSVRKHFWHKRAESVKGFEGGKEWVDAVTNAKEGLRSVMNYMDHALKWAELQENMKPLKELFKDEQITKHQPEAHKWSQGYIDQATGRSTKMARGFDMIVDQVAEHTGVGQSMMLKGIRETKDWMTSLYLGFWNVGFSISQLVQITQTIPAWQLMLKNKGAEASVLRAYGEGTMEAAKYMMPSISHNISPLTREAMEHARQHAVIAPKILDDTRSQFERQRNQVGEWIRTKNMTVFEQIARTQAYLTWVHFLKNTGEFRPGRELYETAANLTDMTMVDYRSHERAMLYKQLGIVGEMSNALTSYKHNYYTQIWALNAHRKGLPNKAGVPTSRSGGLSPLGALTVAGLMLSGLIGLPGREDVDGIIRGLNLVGSHLGNKRIPTTRELFMDSPDWAAFGGVSAVTGLDLSGKFSAANIMPDNALAFLQPFAAGVGDMAGNTLGALMDPSMASVMQLGASSAPGAAKAGFEEYFTDEHGMFNDPEKLEARYKRGTRDKVARYMALRSTGEARAMHKNRDIKDADSFYMNRRSHILEKAHKTAFSYEKGDMGLVKELQKLGREYVAAEGKPEEFKNEILSKVGKQHHDTLTRALLSAMSNPQRAKRVQEQMK